jgi:hypothetical protein
MDAFSTSRTNKRHKGSIFRARRTESTTIISDQLQSNFFSKLYPELRASIYRYAFPDLGAGLHIACRNRHDNRLAHVPCLLDSERDLRDWEQDSVTGSRWGPNHQACSHAFEARFEKEKPSRLKSFLLRPASATEVTGTMLTMMLSCRQMLASLAR